MHGYGVRIRKRLNAVLKQTKAKHACPYCGKTNVRRKEAGIWACRSCGAEFAGGAYTPTTEVGTTAKKFVESVKNK